MCCFLVLKCSKQHDVYYMQVILLYNDCKVEVINITLTTCEPTCCHSTRQVRSLYFALKSGRHFRNTVTESLVSIDVAFVIVTGPGFTETPVCRLHLLCTSLSYLERTVYTCIECFSYLFCAMMSCYCITHDS